MEKTYDRAYFDRWYRSRRRVVTPQSIGRKASLALAAAEYFLERPVRSVLDIGCGEGAWRAVLRRKRPGIRWVGVDPSEYVVRRFGRRRNIRLGSFGDLPGLRLGGPFDLVVSSDALQYVPTSDLRRALPALARMLRGVAWLEAHTADDALDGDREGWHLRSERQYRRLFDDVDLVPLGLHCWVPRGWIDGRWVSRLERAD